MFDAIIREATVADAEGIARVQVETWRHAYRGQIADALLDSLSVEQRTQVYQQYLGSPAPKAHTLVALDNGTLCGFCSVGASPELEDDRTGVLYAIYVYPNAQGRGVGSALLDEGVRQLRAEGFTRATLWVLESNTPSRQFYEHKGWAADGASKIEMWGGFELPVVRYAIRLA